MFKIIESYITVECERCKKVLLVNLGDLSDLSRQDVEVIMCTSCGYIDWLEPVDDIQDEIRKEDGLESYPAYDGIPFKDK